MPRPSAPAAEPLPRLSIVVLPFANLSNDPDQEYFVDGITDDLTTDLSRISGSFVIARNTAFTYKGKPVDAKQVGRELGIRYVLEGSVRRAGDKVQVNVQLIRIVEFLSPRAREEQMLQRDVAGVTVQSAAVVSRYLIR